MIDLGHASINYYPILPISFGVKDGVRFPVSAQVTMVFSKVDRCERNTKELSTTVYMCSTHMHLCSMGACPAMEMP